MLQPPQPKDGMVRAKDPLPVQCTLHDILPGSAASSKPQHLHCVAADDADECRCLAPLARGGRCSRKRVEGNFCRQHYLDWSAKDKNEKILSEWRDVVEEAAVTWLVALPSYPPVISCQVYIWLAMTDAIFF